MKEYDGYVLLDYELFKAKLIRENKKTFTVFTDGDKKHIVKDKYVSRNVPFCVVWERWKGVNGRGAYRLDTKKYYEYHSIGGRSKINYVSEETP